MIIFAGSLFTIAIIASLSIFALSTSWFWYYDMPSLFYILAVLIFFSQVSRSGKVINNYIKSSFQKNYEYSATELEMIALSAKNMLKLSHATGWFGFFAGAIHVLVAFTDQPEMLGPATGVSFISALYGIAIGYFVFFPLQAWAENKLLLLKHE